MTKNKHLLLDILIGVLVIAAIILIDHLIINWQSRPADLNGGQEGQEGQGGQEGFSQIIKGERVFLPILNFHHIDTAPAKDSKIAQSFYIEPARFEEILQDLLDQGYKFYFVSELISDLKNGQIPAGKPVALTFDDGNEDFYTKAFPILQKYKIKSSMYIMTGVKGSHWLTPEQIVELDKTGLVEFGSHTIFHPYLTKVSTERQIHELTDSKKFLEDLLKKTITIICYPFGFYNAQVEQEAKDAGYIAGLTFDQEAWQNPENLMQLTRISVYPSLDVVKFLALIKKFTPKSP